MQIQVFDTEQQIAFAVSAILLTQIREKPQSVLGFATGSSPVATYQKLIEAHENDGADFSKVITFNLDEYCDLAQSDPHSYYSFMREQLFEKAGFDYSRVHFLTADTADHESVCRAYRAEIERCGGIDIQLLGIGRNGHIGFNEPADDFPVITHVVDLTESTINANSRLFDSIDEVPRQAYTMGIGTIMKAREILLVVNGEGKAEIVRDVLTGPVTPRVPASALQLHPKVTVVLDKEAAKLL